MGLTRDRLALLLEVLGGLFVVAGTAILFIWLGLVVAGLVLILFGVALERLKDGDL
jgi:hypothetical protein